MAEQIFTQKISEDAAGRKHVSIGQTRDGKDEWITPVTMWEKNKLSGLYLPPGFLPDDDVAMPRVKVQLPGSENFAKDLTIQEVTSELELVKAELQTIKTNQLSGDQKVQLYGTVVEEKVIIDYVEIRDTSTVSVIIDTSRYKSFELVAVNTLGKEVRFTAGFDDAGNEFRYYNAEEDRWVRLNHNDPLGYGIIPATPYEYRQLLSGAFPFIFSIRSVKTRFNFRCEEAPTEGSLRVILYGEVK